MPAKAAIQKYLKTLYSRLRGNDAKERFETFYETVKLDPTAFYILPWPCYQQIFSIDDLDFIFLVNS